MSDCGSAGIVKLSPPLTGGSALMSKTVLCGWTFVVSLQKLWLKGLHSLQAKTSSK